MPQKIAATSPRVRELTERLERNPAPRIFMELAKEHQAAGDLEEAARVCRQGLDRHPSYHSARVLLARVLIDLERFGDAVPELENVVRQAPDNLLARRLLGEARVGSGDREGGLKTLRELQTLNPDDSDLASRIRGLESPEELPTPAAEEIVTPAAGAPEAITAETTEPEVAETEIAEPPAVEEPEAVTPAVAPEPPAEEPAERIGEPVSAEAVERLEEEVTEPSEMVEAPSAVEPEDLVAETAEPEVAETEVAEPPAVGEPEAVTPAVAPEPPAEEPAERIGEPVSAEAVERLEEEVTEPSEMVEAPSVGEPEDLVAETAEPEVAETEIAEPPAVEEPEAVTPAVAPEPPAEEPAERIGEPVSAEAVERLEEEVTKPSEVVEASSVGEPEEVTAESAPEFRTVALSPESLAAESFSETEAPRAEARAEAGAPAEEPRRRTGESVGALATPTLAEIYYQQGLPEKAAETYEQVLAGDPDNEEVRSRLRQIRSELPRAASAARRKIRALETWLGRIRRSRNAQDRA